MAVTIRSAVLEDVAALLAIEQQASSAAHWTRGQYQVRLADGVILVSEEKGSIAGFVCAREIAGEWEIENIVVAEQLRRRGIANELLKDLLRCARTGGSTAVRLEVRESNAAARRLYEKHGFHESGRRRGYYGNSGEDAVLYEVLLNPSANG